MDIKHYKFTGKEQFEIKNFKTKQKGEFASREDAVEEFISNLKEIHLLQQRLYAERKESVIFVFQAMDAAGKDGTIRTVFSTLSPHGVKEYCFKAPSQEELSHDYLWRFWSALPAKGNISILNRSYYEDVLVGKVHKLYENQLVPDRLKDVDVIKKRYKEINDFEKYLYNNGTRIVKIFLNVSKEEQAKRFISRIETPRKNWKISEGDIKEREYWDEYQEAFETMINKTSSKKSPWYVVPADHKWYARLIVSRIVLNTLKEIDPQFPTITEEEFEKIQAYKDELYASLENSKKSDKKPKGGKKKEKQDKIDKKNKKDKSNKDNKEKDDSDVSKKIKKHKKHKKDKIESEDIFETSDVVQNDNEVTSEPESVFADASVVVTDNIIEEEQAKIDEKNEQEKHDNIDDDAEVDVNLETSNGVSNNEQDKDTGNDTPQNNTDEIKE